jgi:hypothetical protein
MKLTNKIKLYHNVDIDVNKKIMHILASIVYLIAHIYHYYLYFV